MSEALAETRLTIRLETSAGKLVAEAEIAQRPVAPAVIVRAGVTYVKIAGRPAFPWQPVVYREAEALTI